MSLTHRVLRASAATAAAAAMAALAVAPAAQASSPSSFIGHFHKISKIASTVPRNGDVNPYGVAVVSRLAARQARL